MQRLFYQQSFFATNKDKYYGAVVVYVIQSSSSCFIPELVDISTGFPDFLSTVLFLGRILRPL